MKKGRLDVRVVLAEGAMPPRSRLDLRDLRRAVIRAGRGNGVLGGVNLVLTGDEDLRLMNRKFRGIDAPTDVLSFDLGDGEDGLAGEVYLSLPYARRRASLRKQSLQREVKHLAVHGILHIAGHDHETEAGWKAMERETRKYM